MSVLEKVIQQVPETYTLMVMGEDGISVAKQTKNEQPNLEGLAAECTTLLRNSMKISRDTGLGELQEIWVTSDTLVALMMSITKEYFIFAAMSKDVLRGRARFFIKMACSALESELQ